MAELFDLRPRLIDLWRLCIFNNHLILCHVRLSACLNSLEAVAVRCSLHDILIDRCLITGLDNHLRPSLHKVEERSSEGRIMLDDA